MPPKARGGRRSASPGRTRKLRRAEKPVPRAPMTEATEAIGGREPAGQPMPSAPRPRQSYQRRVVMPERGLRLYRPPGPDVSYVLREVRRIGLLTGGMILLLVAAYIVLR